MHGYATMQSEGGILSQCTTTYPIKVRRFIVLSKPCDAVKTYDIFN